MKTELIERLKIEIRDAEITKEDMDAKDWGAQEGTLISFNEAKLIVKALAEKKQEKPTKEEIIKKLYQLAQIGQTHDGVMMTRIFEKEAEMILELFS